jgi:tRNA-intron endonuclease
VFILSELPRCILKDGKGLVLGPDADRIHQQGFFGELEGGKLILSDVEILFLLEKEKMALEGESGKPLTFPDLVESLSWTDNGVWLRYLLYSDLRRRGYIVKAGFGPKLEYRVYSRGAVVGKEPAKFLVYGLVEGRTVAMNELTSISNSAKLSKKDLILAVIDRQGEITYYDTSEVAL